MIPAKITNSDAVTKNIGIFLGLAFGISWLFWIPAALLDQQEYLIIAVILYYIGGFGPSLAGVIMIDRTQDKQGQKDFLKRLIGFNSIGGWWYAFIFLIFPAFLCLTVLIYRITQNAYPDLPALAGISGQLLTLPLLALMILLIGPLSEEIGWRGFALDQLQQRWSALVSSLVLGVVWSLWHLPLFFIEGTMYSAWGFGGLLFWLFILRMVCLSVIMTWVYNNNRRSILSAVLMHFTFNFTFSFLQPAPDEVHLYGTLIFLVFVLVVCWFWGPRSLVRPKKDDPKIA